MSDLSRVKELLKKDCLCHAGSNLNYALESMPASIRQPDIKLGCDCHHGQEKAIKKALREFKTYIETKAKFKVGDRVELAETPYISLSTAHGWIGCEHFLIEGGKATVADVDFRGEFGYAIVFDNESWKDDKGNLHPKNNKKCTVAGCTFPKHNAHTFYFTEDKLRAAGAKPCDFLKKLWYDFYKIGD